MPNRRQRVVFCHAMGAIRKPGHGNDAPGKEKTVANSRVPGVGLSCFGNCCRNSASQPSLSRGDSLDETLASRSFPQGLKAYSHYGRFTDGLKCVRENPVVHRGLRGFSHLTQHSASLRAGLSCHAPAALCFSGFLLRCQQEKLVLTQTLKAVPFKSQLNQHFPRTSLSAVARSFPTTRATPGSPRSRS
jgi:hypothetical protein